MEPFVCHPALVSVPKQPEWKCDSLLAVDIVAGTETDDSVAVEARGAKEVVAQD
jgi:hypothetical protein